MTKVEELRADVIKNVAHGILHSANMDPWTDPMAAAAREVNALIAAVHAEGMAEGAEQERERIRGAAFGVFDNCGSLSTSFLEGTRVIYIGKLIPITDEGSAFVPASVLAPKESEK
jgi:hypothetical protein